MSSRFIVATEFHGQETKLPVGVAINRVHRLLNIFVRVYKLLHALVGDIDIIVWTINTVPYTTAIGGRCSISYSTVY